MSMYSDLGTNTTRILLAQGAAQANAKRANAQLWGQTLASLGQIPAQFQAQKDAELERLVREQEMTVRASQLARQQRQDAAEQAAGQAISADGVLNEDGSVNLEQLRQHLQGTPGAAKFPELAEHFTKLQETNLSVRKLRQDLDALEADQMGRIAAGASVSDDPHEQATALLIGLDSAVKGQTLGKDKRDAIVQQFVGPDGQPNPDAVTRVIASMRQASKEQQEAMLKQAMTAASLANTAADNARADRAEQRAEQTASMTAENTAADNARADKQLAISQGQLDLARQREKRESSQTVAGAGGAGNLTPEGLDLAATQYRVTGQMPPMGMGRTPERFAVINKAAEQTKLLGQTPANAIQKQAAFKGDANALKQMQTLSAGAQASESKAIGQIQLIRELSQKVPRTQIPLLNSAIQAGRINLLGDTNAQQLANAIQTFANEYGKIIEGSTASVAGASDTSRAVAGKLVNASMNPKTLDDVLRLMQREMDLTIAGYDASINHITEKMGGIPQTPAAPAPTGNRIYYDSNGNPVKR